MSQIISNKFNKGRISELNNRTKYLIENYNKVAAAISLKRVLSVLKQQQKL
jgi:hypothetical protein